MVALRCAPCIQENGQGQIFVLIQQNTAITSSQLRAKSGSSEFTTYVIVLQLRPEIAFVQIKLLARHSMTQKFATPIQETFS